MCLLVPLSSLQALPSVLVRDACLSSLILSTADDLETPVWLSLSLLLDTLLQPLCFLLLLLEEQCALLSWYNGFLALTALTSKLVVKISVTLTSLDRAAQGLLVPRLYSIVKSY